MPVAELQLSELELTRNTKRRLGTAVHRLVDLLLMPPQKFQDELSKDSSSVIEHMLYEAVKKNRWDVVNSLIDRVLGTPTKVVEVSEFRPERKFSFPNPQVKIGSLDD